MPSAGLAVAAALLAAILFTGCGQRDDGAITSIAQLDDSQRKIGVAADTAEDRLIMQELPNAQIEYYTDGMAAFTSVAQGKINAFVFDRVALETAIRNGMEGVRLLDESLGEGNFSAAAISPVTKIPDLEGKINAFLKEIEEDGTREELEARWLDKQPETMPELPVADSPEYHLVVGTTGTNMPFTYYIGTDLAGYDIELACRFAVWLGASIEFKVYDYDGIVAAAQSGDVDCIFANLFVTPERQEAISFSDPTFVGEIGVMVRDAGASPRAGTETDEAAATASTADADGEEAPGVVTNRTLEDFRGKRIGVLQGSFYDAIASERIPDIELSYYKSTADMLVALKAKKTDAFVTSEPVVHVLRRTEPGLACLSEAMLESPIAFALPKTAEGEQLNEQLSTFILELKEAGTLDEIDSVWFGSDESAKVTIDLLQLEGTNGTLVMATTGAFEPLSYIRDGEVTGFDVDLATRFCAEYGYGLQIQLLDLDGILSSLQSGKCDFAGAGLAVTEERKEKVDFSEPYFSSRTVLAVLEDGEDTAPFFDSVRESFEKTFLRENRWKLFLSGICTTLLITGLAILFGTALGFGVYMACRGGNPLVNGIARVCLYLVQGMPVVVLLMILYYILFGNVNVSGTLVAVVAFTLVFGAAVFGMLKVGVGAVDAGQLEAALALGYPDRKAFYRVILPQAVSHILPVYLGEITALIKATAVVGYIAVQDLTRMGDLVRSRTYDAFFPLIAVAVIYFLLASILTRLVRRLTARMDMKNRGRQDILKGVDLHD